MSIWLLSDICTVDDNSQEHCIIKNERPIPIREQAWTLLLALIEAKQNQEILTYVSLARKLWPNSNDLIIDKYVRDTMRKACSCVEDVLGEEAIKVVRNKGFYLTNDIKEVSKLSLDVPHILTYNVAPYTDEQRILHRGSEINEIMSLLDSGQNAIAISGFGGIGKTSVARVLYGRLSTTYDFVAWVNYSENLKNSILSSFSIFNEILDENQRWLSITRFMKNDTGKKLIFIDNVDYTNEQNPMTDTWLQEIPSWTCCSVILTTRMEEVFGYHQIFLKSLNETESMDLFYFYYSPKGHKALSNEKKNESIVKQIIQRAGYHTYVVELLARGASRSESLEIFYNKLATLGFQIPTLKFYTEYSRINEDIAGQLKLLYDVSNKTEVERQILYSLSIFPNISLSFSELFDWLGYSEFDVENLINEGWLILQQGIYMHPLVKEIIRLDYVNSKCPIGVAKKMQTLLLNGNYINDSDSLSNTIRKIEIASLCIVHVPFNEQKEEMNIYYNIATHLKNFGKPSAAVNFYRKSLQIAEHLYKNHTIDELTIANIEIDLGYQLSYTRSGRTEAFNRLSKVLELLNNLPTDVNVNKIVATVYDYLGYLCSDDDYTKAKGEELLKMALVLRKCDETSTDADKHLFAWTEDNLGFLLNSTDAHESIILLKDSLKIREELEVKYPGKYYSEVAWTMNNLGVTFLCGIHDPSTATQYFKCACNILKPYYENCHGLNSADYALHLNNLAIAMLSESYKNNNRAIKILEKSIEINRDLNYNHKDMYSFEIALTLINLAFSKLLNRSAHVQEAKKALDEARTLISNQDISSTLEKQILGDISYVTGLLNLITDNSVGSQKRFDEAVELWSTSSLDKSRKGIINNVIDSFTNYTGKITLTDKLRENILSLWIKYVQSGSRWVSLIENQNPINFSNISNNLNVYIDDKINIKNNLLFKS